MHPYCLELQPSLVGAAVGSTEHISQWCLCLLCLWSNRSIMHVKLLPSGYTRYHMHRKGHTIGSAEHILLCLFVLLTCLLLYPPSIYATSALAGCVLAGEPRVHACHDVQTTTSTHSHSGWLHLPLNCRLGPAPWHVHRCLVDLLLCIE